MCSRTVSLQGPESLLFLDHRLELYLSDNIGFAARLINLLDGPFLLCEQLLYAVVDLLYLRVTV